MLKQAGAAFVIMGLVSAAQTRAADSPASATGVASEKRARTNYMLNCQGCHGANAEGNDAASVPRMQDFVANFLKVPGGREFLVQVPGSANASIGDAELAELLNWMIPFVSIEQLPDDFVPYTETEIAALRYSPEEDVVGTRKRLIQAISELQPN